MSESGTPLLHLSVALSADDMRALTDYIAACRAELVAKLAASEARVKKLQGLFWTVGTLEARLARATEALREICTHSVCCDARHVASAALAEKPDDAQERKP